MPLMKDRAELDHHMRRCKANLEEVFSGFVAIGLPLDGGSLGTPACILTSPLGVPEMQRLATVLRAQARHIERTLDTLDDMAREAT